jgi:outer membrane protein TolC
MKQTKTIFMASLLLLMAFISVSAQQQGLTLSLDEAKSHALVYNNIIRKAGLSLKQAQSKTWESIAAGLPQVNASIGYQNPMGAEITLDMGVPGMPPTVIPIKPTSNLQLQVTQLVFNGAYWVGLQMTKIAEQMSETSLRKSEQDIKEQVTTAYLSVLIAEETYKLLNQNMDNLRKLQQNTDAMVAAGVSEQTNADQLSVQVAAMENSIQSSLRQIELAKNMLRMQLGVQADTDLQLTDNLKHFLDNEKVLSLLIVPYDVNQDLNLQLVNKNLELAKKQVNMEASTYLPTVSAYYNHTFKLMKTDFDMQPSDVIGVSASIPIFSSGKNYSKLKQAKLKLQAAEIDKESTSDQLLIQEQQLRFNLKNAYEKYQTQQKNIDVSQRVFQSIAYKYEYGKASGLDLTNASNSLLGAQSNYISALFELINAQVALEKLLNKI